MTRMPDKPIPGGNGYFAPPKPGPEPRDANIPTLRVTSRLREDLERLAGENRKGLSDFVREELEKMVAARRQALDSGGKKAILP